MRLAQLISNHNPKNELERIINKAAPLTDAEYELLKETISFFNLLKVRGIDDDEPYTPAENRFIIECQ